MKKLILEYKEECKKAKEQFIEKNPNWEEKKIPRPQMGEELGNMILKIGERLSYSPNFKYYTYREEMISDGICNLIKYIENYDEEKSKNAFSYVTTIFYYAFLARINSEKKDMYTKYKLNDEAGNYLDHDFGDSPFESYEEKLAREFGLTKKDVENFEQKSKKKSKKSNKTNTDNDVSQWL